MADAADLVEVGPATPIPRLAGKVPGNTLLTGVPFDPEDDVVDAALLWKAWRAGCWVTAATAPSTDRADERDPNDIFRGRSMTRVEEQPGS